MTQLRLLSAALVLLVLSPLPPARAAEDPKSMALAESTGAFGGALLWDIYLSFVQTEKQLSKGSDAALPLHVALHLANLGIVQTYDKKMRDEFTDDASMLGFLLKMDEAQAAVKAQGEALQACLKSGPSGLAAVKEKHAAAKALLVSLLSLPDGGKNMP
jgi:hypothetical protein